MQLRLLLQLIEQQQQQECKQNYLVMDEKKNYYWSLCEFYGSAFDEKHKSFSWLFFVWKEFEKVVEAGMRTRLWHRKTLPFLIYSLYKKYRVPFKICWSLKFLDVSFTHTLAFFSFNNPLFIVILFPYNIIKKCSFLIFFPYCIFWYKLLVVLCLFFLL